MTWLRSSAFSALGVALLAGAVLSTASAASAGREIDFEGTHHVEFTNDSGQAARFLHIQTIAPGASSWAVVDQPAACDQPQLLFGFEYRELVWPEACVGPGETVAFELSKTNQNFGHYWAPSMPIVSAVNDTDRRADALVIDRIDYYKGWMLVENAPGCPEPVFDNTDNDTFGLHWDIACVDPGEKVAIHLGATRSITAAPYEWVLVLYGDVRCDGIANSEDAAILLQFVSRLLEALPCADRADVNNDGATDALDALLVLQLDAGLLNSLPPVG